MKTIALYLLIQGFGWIKFEEYDTMKACEIVKTHVVEGHPNQLEGLCLEVKKDED